MRIEIEADLRLEHGNTVVDVRSVDGRLRVDLHRWRDLFALWSQRHRGSTLIRRAREAGVAGSIRVRGVPVRTWS